MATEVEARLEARADNLAALDREALNKTTHGIAARIDKMPVGKWQPGKNLYVAAYRTTEEPLV